MRIICYGGENGLHRLGCSSPTATSWLFKLSGKSLQRPSRWASTWFYICKNIYSIWSLGVSLQTSSEVKYGIADTRSLNTDVALEWWHFQWSRSCQTLSLEVSIFFWSTFQTQASDFRTVFSALRVFALSGRNWVVSGFVLVLDIVPVFTNLVSTFKKSIHEYVLKYSEQYAVSVSFFLFVDDPVLGQSCYKSTSLSTRKFWYAQEKQATCVTHSGE